MFRFCMWIQSAFVINPCYCFISLMCFLSQRLLRSSYLPRDPHCLFTSPVYIYLSLYTLPPSELWSFSVPNNQYGRLLRFCDKRPFVLDLQLLPDPFDLPFWITVYGFCFVYFIYDSCLLPGTSALRIFGFDSRLLILSLKISDYLATELILRFLHTPWSASGSLPERNIILLSSERWAFGVCIPKVRITPNITETKLQKLKHSESFFSHWK